MTEAETVTVGATAFTPGPWKVGRRDKTMGELFIVPRGDAAPVGAAFLYDTGRSAEENKANARLIAAAPEMYEALRAVDADFRQTIFPPASHASGREARRLVHKVRAALRAAGGSDG